jgi:hypothetical protein
MHVLNRYRGPSPVSVRHQMAGSCGVQAWTVLSGTLKVDGQSHV